MTPKNHFEINRPLKSNQLDLKRKKNQRKQPTFSPDYIQNFLDYSRPKVLNVNWKKVLVVADIFFPVSNQVGWMLVIQLTLFFRSAVFKSINSRIISR